MNLTITPVYAHNAIVVHLAGKLGGAGVAQLRDHLLHLFAAGHLRVVVDLRHLSVLDPDGMQVLLDARAYALTRHGWVRLACAPAVLEIYSLNALGQLARYDSIEAALADATQPEPEPSCSTNPDTGNPDTGNPAAGSSEATALILGSGPWTTVGGAQAAAPDLGTPWRRHHGAPGTIRSPRAAPADVAAQAVDAIAELAWAVLPLAEADEQVDELGDVLSELARLAELLQWVNDHLAVVLHTVRPERVRAVAGYPHAGDPAAAIAEATRLLSRASDLAAQLHGTWRSCGHAITGLVRDPPAGTDP